MQANDAKLRTNDHFLSLTDQLNLGLRAVELDTHWVEVGLEIGTVSPLFALSSCQPVCPALAQAMEQMV